MKLTIIASVLVAFLLIAASIFSKGGADNVGSADNVSVADGVQIVEISARGGYQPRKSIAQAGIPTVVRFKTNGTFDCSIAVRIPSLNISKNLPSMGTTDIDIGTPAIGKLQGSCSMGMYPFEIEFKS